MKRHNGIANDKPSLYMHVSYWLNRDDVLVAHEIQREAHEHGLQFYRKPMKMGFKTKGKQ